MAVKSEWIDLSIALPISESDLIALDAVIAPVASLLETTLELAKGLLEASKLFLIEDFSPLAALQAALAAELNNLIGSLQDSGVGMTFMPPEISNLKPLNDNLDQLAVSVLDAFDSHRPISEGTSAQVYLFVLTARAQFPEILFEIWNKLMDLIFSYDKYELQSLKELGAPYNNAAKGYTQLPDWSGVKLPEAIPIVGYVLDFLRHLTENLIDISTVQTDLIDTAIELLSDKIADISDIQSLLDSLILQIQGAELLSGNGLDMLYINGQATERELFSAIAAAKSSLPDNTGTDVSALCAFYATSPEVGEILKSFFTGST